MPNENSKNKFLSCSLFIVHVNRNLTAQNMNQWRTRVNMVMNFDIHNMIGISGIELLGETKYGKWKDLDFEMYNFGDFT